VCIHHPPGLLAVFFQDLSLAISHGVLAQQNISISSATAGFDHAGEVRVEFSRPAPSRLVLWRET